MQNKTVRLGQCSFDLLTRNGEFLGMGKVWIGDTLARSGRLPLKVYTQSFTGLELASLRFISVSSATDQIRIRLEASFRQLPVKLMRDHSFDPIHETADWDAVSTAGTGRLDLVLEPAKDKFNGIGFEGFSYRWEYKSDKVPLFYLLDMASWELDGDITGATAFSQSSCSAPVAKFDKETAWTTEGVLFFLVEQGNANPVMTHNLPRWASHGSFDFQFKGDKTLIGVFERVDLIRSLLKREAGKPELKTFDKHIFDQALKYATSAKKIMLNTDPKTEVSQQNLWTWVSDEVDRRARAEFGMKEEPTIPRMHCNFWHNFTVDSYYRDLLPAAVNIGCKRVFVDNLKKSAMTERAPLPGVFNWNMCCGHEYEISDKLGGVKRVKDFVDSCKQHGIQVMFWTCNTQALSSPLNSSERDDKGWFVLLEDTRQKYGGAYAGVMSVLDFGVPAVRKHFVEAHVKIKKETGLDIFFDSFYNLGFMPVTYRNCAPRTMWRGCVQVFKELQDAGIGLLIESFGPWGQPMHGHPSSYNMENIFACYKVGMGDDYSTVPGKQQLKDMNPTGVDGLYYTLAHKACTTIPMEVDGKRVDRVWGAPFKQALADYHATLPYLYRRYLQNDGLRVLWHNKAATRGTLWNFKRRRVTLPGTVFDITANRRLPKAGTYTLEACHTYSITGAKLPVAI